MCACVSSKRPHVSVAQPGFFAAAESISFVVFVRLTDGADHCLGRRILSFADYTDVWGEHRLQTCWMNGAKIRPVESDGTNPTVDPLRSL